MPRWLSGSELSVVLIVRSLAGFDAAIHMSEETRHAKMCVPRAMFWSIFSNWGRWGGFINMFALVYTLWMCIFLPFPQNVPVTVAGMNYAGPVMGLALAVTLVLWVFCGKKNWSGPNVAIIDFVCATS